MMNYLCLGLVFGASLMAEVATFRDGVLELDNGLLRRISTFDPAKTSWTPSALELSTAKKNYLRAGGREFSFLLNGELVSGSASGWRLESWAKIHDERGGSGVAVVLVRPGTTVEVRYWLYPGLAVVRKQIEIRNTSSADQRLESVDVESFSTAFAVEKGQVLRGYGRTREYSPIVGSWDDPLIVAHDLAGNRGLAIGNEAPGVLKRTAVFQGRFQVEAGVTRASDAYPFRRWLAPGASWASPKIFIAAYENAIDPASAGWQTTVQTLVRRHIAIPTPAKPPLFLFDSWIPFLTNIREDLLKDLATRAARAGFDTLAVDYGWSANQGDWQLDKKKFPNGLTTPGIWMSLAMVDRGSDVHRNHADWLVTGKDGKPVNFHDLDQNMLSACLGTRWHDHIRDAIFRTVRDYKLRYLKLDFAVATSAYIHEPEKAGCQSKNHPGHRDREESITVAHERMAELADAIRREFPQLYLDITFEAWGKLQQIDYALIQHAHGDWLSNISENSPSGALQMRTLAWSRSAALPTSAMIIGNLKAEDPMIDLNVASLAGALPVMLGDLRKVDPQQESRIRTWANWFRDSEHRHAFLPFRQDLRGFGEPGVGRWDGYSRINTETRTGGIVGIFRAAAPESTRTVFVQGLDPAATYAVRLAPEGRIITRATGTDLLEKGIAVTIPEQHGGRVFEIRRQNALLP